ncbi:hypothetical protein ACPCUF_23950 [Streptomyces griseoincarnatus]
MNARERLQTMVRTDRGSMTVWPESEVASALDAYRDEVLAEVTTWLVKKARGFRAMGGEMRAALASKVDRGAVRPDNLRMLPADFFEPGHTYTVNEPFTAPEIRPHFQCVAVAIHPTTGNRRAFGFEQRTANAPWASASLRDEEWADGWVDVTEETSGPAAPDNDAVARRAHLARAIRQGGRWKSGTVVRWYEEQGYEGLGPNAARNDLAALRRAGVIVPHDEKGVRWYSLARQGGAR